MFPVLESKKKLKANFMWFQKCSWFLEKSQSGAAVAAAVEVSLLNAAVSEVRKSLHCKLWGKQSCEWQQLIPTLSKPSCLTVASHYGAIWGCLLMTLAWLEVAAMLLMLFTGTQRTVAGHKERQKGRGQGAWWTSILMSSSACVLLPWAPAEVQTVQPDPSGRSPLSSYQHIRSSPNCHEMSQKMSGDVLKMSSDVPRSSSDVWGQSLKVHSQDVTLL